MTNYNNNWRNFYNLFIGNSNAYAIQKKDGNWTVIKSKTTKDIIESHLRQETTIGSYYAYTRNRIERCKWLCIDLDLHFFELEDGTIIDNSKKIESVKFPIKIKGKKSAFISKEQMLKYYWQKSGIITYETEYINKKRVRKEKLRIEANELDKLDGLSKQIKHFLISFYNINPENVWREKSGRGYHVWIFLKSLTTLKRAFDFRENIRKKLRLFFNIDTDDIFPKQGSLKGLVKALGNFVKLPLSINRKSNTFCEMLDDFTLNKVIEGFEITKLIKNIKQFENYERKIENREEKELNLIKWTPLENVDNHFFYSRLRPCLKAIVQGRPTHGTGNGHYIRMQVANELFKLKAPIEVRVNAFKNHVDFDPDKTRYQCLDLEMRARRNNRFFVAKCENIAREGWCLPNCPQLDKAKKEFSKKELEELFSEIKLKNKKEYDGIKGGWLEVEKELDKRINNEVKTKEYVVKTTRSGTTTLVIKRTIENNKKILIIAPTIKICEETVKKAIEITKGNPKLFRFGSNKELCLTLFGKTVQIPDLKRFPFLLKDNCKYCQYSIYVSCNNHNDYKKDCNDCKQANKIRDKCNWRIALEDIQDFDIIYITTAKLHALTKTKSPEAKMILNKIEKVVHINFLDEVSEVLNVGNTGITFFADPDPIYRKTALKKDFPRNFNREYKNINIFAENNLTRNEKKIWYGLHDFVKAINNIHKKWKLLRFNNQFIKTNSPLYKILKEIDDWYLKHQRFGSGDRDWLGVYKMLILYTEKTDNYPKYIIDILILAKFPQFYIQYTSPVRYTLQMDVFPAKPIKEFLDFINKLSEKKQFFTTDATEPPIKITTLFPNIQELIINDPMNTAKKQSVYPYPYRVNISTPRYLAYRKDEIKDYIDKHGDSNTMIICQNIFTKREISKILIKGKHYKIITYFRSPFTIGTPSDCRNIITIGSSYPPKNSHRWLADLFLKEKLVDEKEFDLDSLTKHLEYYNAKSMFFQAISRGKDPKGEVESSVYCFGLDYYQICSLLNFKIATPEVKSMIISPDMAILEDF